MSNVYLLSLSLSLTLPTKTIAGAIKHLKNNSAGHFNQARLDTRLPSRERGSKQKSNYSQGREHSVEKISENSIRR
jgi:hypothetical protein